MQITKAEVTPVEMKLRHPVKMASLPDISHITAIFVRLEIRNGQCAWGCTVAHPGLTGEQPEAVVKACQDCADIATGLHPYNLEYSLAELSSRVQDSPAALCAFDLAFHDLLSVAADMPLYRLLGGYRSRIQTSATIPISPVDESVEKAEERARDGFRMLKVKGGINAEADVQRLQAIHRALPNHTLRLDADGGYSVRQAIDVTKALKDVLEMIEQPTPAENLEALREVKEESPVPVLADQSACGPGSALQLAANKMVDGFSIKLASCGGLQVARQMDAIARAGRLTTMVSCVIEPAMLISAGLHFALSSPTVQYGDLDGNLDLANDPSQPGFVLQDGWLEVRDVPGLGYTVNL